ncbi:MAG TPA: hypothetical protein VJB06_04225 [archaeon]|nr:hypothetical protein [archaeon]
MERNYDENFTEKEIGLIDRLIESSISHKRLRTEKELWKVLK